ncbi:MAG: hypothetical protein R3C05_28465 [Pirellulaceae bacterium]
MKRAVAFTNTRRRHAFKSFVTKFLLAACVGLIVLPMGSLNAKPKDSLPKEKAASVDDKEASRGDALSSATDSDSDDSPRELSTKPQQFPIYPEDRPMWVDQPDNIGNGWAELVVQSVPSLSEQKSAESLAEQQQLALAAYAEQVIGVAGSSDLLTFTPEQIAADYVDPERSYHGMLTTSTGEMHQHACVLVLDDAFHTQTVEQWKSLEVAQRLKGLGVLGAAALAGLIVVSGLLKSIAPRTKRQHVEV